MNVHRFNYLTCFITIALSIGIGVTILGCKETNESNSIQESAFDLPGFKAAAKNERLFLSDACGPFRKLGPGHSLNTYSFEVSFDSQTPADPGFLAKAREGAWRAIDTTIKSFGTDVTVLEGPSIEGDLCQGQDSKCRIVDWIREDRRLIFFVAYKNHPSMFNKGVCVAHVLVVEQH